MLIRVAPILTAFALLAACTTSNQQEPDAGVGATPVVDSGQPPPPSRCAGLPCDGICAADLARGEAYCAARCNADNPCTAPDTTCTWLSGETVCLKPYEPIFADGGASSSSSSSSSGGSTSSSSGGTDAGAPDAAVSDAGTTTDAAVPSGDGGVLPVSPVVWLSNRCNLGRVEVNTEKVCTANLTVTVDAEVIDARLSANSPPSLRLLGRGTLPATLQPGTTVALAVHASPSTPGSLAGAIEVVTAGGAVRSLPIEGDAELPAVPTQPRVVVRADGQALAAGASARPEAQVYLDGSQSLNEQGQPATTFQWRMVQMPMGAPATLAAPTSRQTRVLPVSGPSLSPGTYVVGLRVASTEGFPGPEELTTFHVATSDELAVELTWDQKDTDVDLFVFRGGELDPSFNTGPDVCGPANCTANQAAPRWDPNNPPRQGGNPVHQGNVRAGFGPERVVISAPLSGQYVVGARYTNSFNRGVSHALVRVFWRGRLISQARRGLTEGQQWVALRLTLPDGEAELAPGPAPSFCTPRCGAAEVCTNGACVPRAGVTPCESDGDCPAFSACLTGQCQSIQEAPRCITGCPQGTHCLGDTICVADGACSSDDGGQSCLAWECNAVSGACQPGLPPACIQNACDEALSCMEGVCRECVSDGDCGPNTLCDSLSGRCVGTGCLTDAECGSGRICDLRHGGCVLPECINDVECQPVDPRRRCDIDARRCFLPAATCAETEEPNNDASNATVVDPAGLSGELCRGDVDYLRLSTTAGQLLRVTVAWSPFDGNATEGLRAELRSVDGRVLASQVLSALTESVELAALTGGGGDVLLILGGFATAVDQWSYTVSYAQEPLPACLTENGEPNDAYNQASGSLITQGTTTRDLCTPDDVDHHLLLLDGSTLARVELAFDPAEGAMALTLLGTEGVVLSTVTASSSPLVLDHVTQEPEQLVVRVEPAGGSGSAAPRSYTLDVSTSYIANCLEDLHEPNDQQTDARTVEPAQLRGVLCSASDNDWFRVVLANPGPLTVRVDWDFPEDVVDVYLRNPAGQVAAATGAAQPAVIQLSNAPANTYFIHVKPRALPGATTYQPLLYTLTIDSPTSCSDDAAESGTGDDTQGSATSLRDVVGPPLSTQLTGKLCPSDEDWFRVTAADDEQLRFSLQGLAGTTVELRGEGSGSPLATFTAGGAEVVWPVQVLAGTYFLKVAGPTGAYTLQVALEPDPCELPVDETEPNDNAGSAEPLPLDTVRSALICPLGDTDMFLVSVASGGTVTATAQFDATEGDLDLRLLEGGTEIDVNSDVETGTSASTSVQGSPGAATDWLVEVTRKAGGNVASQTYTLAVTQTP
ncbi:MAG: hypothetical protein AB2A00_22790 [Myxococcota bacterium]